MVIPLALFIAFVTCLIFAILNVIKEKKKIVNYISILILGFTILLTLFFPFRLSKAKLELSLYRKDRNHIIEMVKEKKLNTEDSSIIKLPNPYKKTSTGGEIEVYQNDENGMVISFFVLRGPMSGSTKLMYSDRGEEMIIKNAWKNEIKSILKLDENWFYVVTNY